jgi:hypothetical protein
MAKKRRGGLVVGNLERISSKAFDYYHSQITELVGRTHGVYALYKKDHLYYVGLATNLRGRVKLHLKDRHAKKWDAFSLYLVRNVNYMRELESLLVHIAEPKGNILRGKFVRSEDLLDRFRELMEARDRTMREEILRDTRRSIQRVQPGEKTRRLNGGSTAKTHGKVPVLQGLLRSGTKLQATCRGKKIQSRIDRKGLIHLNGEVFSSPSMAAVRVTEVMTNG